MIEKEYDPIKIRTSIIEVQDKMLKAQENIMSCKQHYRSTQHTLSQITDVVISDRYLELGRIVARLEISYNELSSLGILRGQLNNKIIENEGIL